ncbi:MAG: S9 family peptidase [Bacteroidota bacterium]|nr:S9 family peptidase [Bacteroidota bacterium]
MKKFYYPIVFILALQLFAQAIFSQERGKELTLDDIFNSQKFAQKSVRNVKWLNNGQAFLYLETDTAKKQTDIWKYDVKSGKRSLFVNAGKLVLNDTNKAFRIQNYILSPDEKSILFTGVLPAHAVKSGGNFFLYDVKKNKFKQLTDTDKEQLNVKFSPDGKKIGFVRDNNIFVLDIETGIEKQLTTDGEKHILNGRFDWVYEEEWSIIDGWQWSPDGKSIAYWQLDERRVPEFTITDYTQTHPPKETMRYPKAGDPNSIVRIGVVSLKTMLTRWMDIGSDDDIYIPRIKWTKQPNHLCIFRVNRLQNKLDLLCANTLTGETRVLSTEESSTWVEIEDASLNFLSDGGFIISSEKDGFMHLYRYDRNGKQINQITKGEWEVKRVLGLDEKNEIIYFTANEKSPLERHLYSIKLNGSKLTRISREEGTHNINISPDYSVYLDTYSNKSMLPKINLHTVGGKLIRVVEENKVPAYDEYRLSQKEFFTFKSSDGTEFSGWMMKPVDFSAEGRTTSGGDQLKKYPVLMYVYGGPGSQTVLNEWDRNILWYTLLTQKGYIIVSVDGRGTGGRGKAFKSITYKNLGKWETTDQIEGAKYLASLPYVDASRIGIWGWSYGGYMACMSILLGDDVFKTAVSVAPVTDWKFYDTIYTERFMQTPELNPDGYRDGASTTHASKLKGNLLIIHGTADDNVHWQNTIALVSELQKHNKQFQTAFYPGGTHGVAGGIVRLQLYTMITDYILEKL